MQKSEIVPSDPREGNTTPPAKSINPAKHWCFTFHKYNEININNFIDIFVKNNVSYIFSEELGEEGETPHLQGYIRFPKKSRPSVLKLPAQVHWEVARAGASANQEYICKEGGTLYYSADLYPADVFYKKKILDIKLKQWQLDLVEKIPLSKVEERKINWYYDSKGGCGKTTLCKYLVLKYQALVVSGSPKDAQFGIVNFHKVHGSYPRIILWNLARDINVDEMNYASIEQIKDGLFFSAKYESTMCLFTPPHIVIFSNSKPNKNKLSKDRFEIVDLSKYDIHPISSQSTEDICDSCFWD